MNKHTILAVQLLAGTLLLDAGFLQAEPAPSPGGPAAVAQQQPQKPPAPPPPPAPAPALPPKAPAPPPAAYPTWMPMHYNMPMHYRTLEPDMVYGYQLMTPQERINYMTRIHSARSFEERERLRFEHHRLMQERARKRNLRLPDMPAPPGRGPGAGPGPKW